MSLWDTIKSWASSLWRWVKNAISWNVYDDTVKNDENQDTWKQTLNEQIANWNINNPVNVNDTLHLWEWLDQLASSSVEEQTPDIKQESTTSVSANDAEDDSFLSKLWNWFSSTSDTIAEAKNDINSWINNLVNSRRAKADYNSQEEMYAVGYNPENRNVYYLDLNEDRWLFDWDFGVHEWVRDRFENLWAQYVDKVEQPWITQAEMTQAYMDFYNEAKKLFRIRADDYYTDWLFWKTPLWRRDEMYSQDELDYLSNNGKTEKRRYEPTPEEFQDFVAMYLRNANVRNQLWIEYTPASDETEEFDLSNMQSDWMAKNKSIAMQNVEKMFEPMNVVNPNSRTNALMTYESSVLPSWLWRWYSHASGVYRAEQEILSRDKSTWSENDKETLKAADILRQMDAKFAWNINELLRQTLLYWTNKKWDIVNTPDIFENGESLNDVLTDWLRELAWIDRSWYSPHQSWIDIVEKFSNDTLYNYRKDKDTWLKGAWNTIEQVIRPLWVQLWEVWQAAWALWMDAVWAVSMGTLYDWLTKSYMDQDATMRRLMETDDSNIWRTVKKYYLDVTEYTPEVLWNLLPDIAAYVVTGPGGLTTTARHIGNISRTYKAVKAAEWVSLLNKFRVMTWLARWEKAAEALWMSRNAYSAIINAAKTAPKIKNYQTLKTWAELVDRFVTQVWMWQIMDAQRSAYDTEPYSQASYMMSVLGSTIFDAMPELVRLATWRHWFNLATWIFTWNFWDNIRSLARYIDSSEEAANNIGRALRKWTWELWFEDLKTFVRNYWAIEDAAKQAYRQLTPEQKAAIGKMTKDLTYSYVNQAFWANSTIWKTVRQILQNSNTNVADVVKYLWGMPWEVEIGPFVSSIKFKNWVKANAYVDRDIYKDWNYDPVLDSIFGWWFNSRVKDWFSEQDLAKLGETKWYTNIEGNRDKYFDKVVADDWTTTYYLNKEWLSRFGLKAEAQTLESLWITLKEAENTYEALNSIKWIQSVNLSDTTIDNLANTWAYEEITLKVREVLWC